MKILIIDIGRDSLDFALRCMAHGHDVRVYIDKEEDGTRRKLVSTYVGDGLVTKIREWGYDDLRWADMTVLTENAKHVDRLVAARKRGYPIWGATVDSAKWEMDRIHGQKMFKEAGIGTLPYVECSSAKQAEKYILANPDRYVCKPCGDADRAMSYCSSGMDDMLFMLERWDRDKAIHGKFIIQQFKKGIEMAIGAWIGPNGFSTAVNENFEFKKLMNDDYGVNTPEMGTTIFYPEESKLFEKMLKPLEDRLVAAGHTGYVDVNCIIDNEGNPWPMEFTMRNGYPHNQIVSDLHKGDPAEWMLDLLNGYDTLQVKSSCVTGVVFAQADHPYSHFTQRQVTGIPVYGITESNAERIHPIEMMMGQAPKFEDGKSVMSPILCTAGDVVLVATGLAKTVKESAEKAYALIDKLDMPNSPIVRTDIGKRLEKQLPKLQSMGYAIGIDYE